MGYYRVDGPRGSINFTCTLITKLVVLVVVLLSRLER